MSIDDFMFDDQMNSTAPIGSFPTHGSEKLMVVIFIVDCSKSMEDNGRIQAVNAALHELKFRLSEIKSNNNLDLKLAIMGFTSSAKWELDLTPIDEVVLNNISVRAGLTEYGTVFRELNRVLCKDEFMNHVGKKAAPVIVFLTDGEPTDDYSSDLELLMKNGWFSCANRSAILMGDAFNNANAKNAVEKFVNNPLTDVVSADDTTVVTEKITAATIHTVAGDPLKDSTVNDSPLPTNTQFPDDPFGNAIQTDSPFSDNPLGNSDSTDSHFPDDLFGGAFSDDTPFSDDIANNTFPTNSDSPIDSSVMPDTSITPFSDTSFDSLFPNDPSFASDSNGILFSDDFGGADNFS